MTSRTPRFALTGACLAAAFFVAAPVCGSGDDRRTRGEDPPTFSAETAGGRPSATAFATPPSPPELSALYPTPEIDDPMSLGGSVFVDATQPSEYEVIAYIDGLECGRAQSFRPLHSDGPMFGMTIASDAQIDGCGKPGDEVTLTVNGREVNRPYEWQPGWRPSTSVTLIVGPPPARYYGEIRFDVLFDQSDIWPQRVVPYIDGKVCGAQSNPMQGNGQVGYLVVVMPDELQPGCGRDGATINLRLELMLAGRPVEVELQDVQWQPGSIVNLDLIDLSGRFIVEEIGVP